MSRPLANQIAIISGGLGDIGRAIALELARCGADVALSDVLEARQAHSTLQRIKALRRRCCYHQVDVTDANAVEEWVDRLRADLGLPTLIIPAAAVVKPASLTELTASRWREELSVNLDGAFHVTQAATRRLLEKKKRGRVIFVGSWAGHTAHTHIAAYCVSKAGLRMLCRCMAAELAPHGILVNEIAPGYVNAGLSGRFFKADPAVRDQCRKRVPSGRLIESDEVARQVAWLCGPEGVHYVGATLVMDGGLSLHGPAGRQQAEGGS